MNESERMPLLENDNHFKLLAATMILHFSSICLPPFDTVHSRFAIIIVYLHLSAVLVLSGFGGVCVQ
jgi:hypothetical protein